ncbi:MAG: hypothetical protein KBG84_03045 [Planctomycetes bacterium]|nr:hypothetical protein [Planctomycetota bacterium]
MATVCEECGNHGMTRKLMAGIAVEECEVCGHLAGPSEVIELMELQREAEELGASPDSYPLAQFIEKLPGVRVLGDSGGDEFAGTMPHVSFELSDHRTVQLENIAQALRLMRDELECHWMLEFTYDFQLGYELKVRRDEARKATPTEIDAARRDFGLMWRRLQNFTGLGWWKR